MTESDMEQTSESDAALVAELNAAAARTSGRCASGG
jgi:hypothetical protein